jgi:hypothetical protein
MKTFYLFTSALLLVASTSHANARNTISCVAGSRGKWMVKLTADAVDGDTLRNVEAKYFINDRELNGTARERQLEADPKYRPRNFMGYKRFFINGDSFILPPDFESSDKFEGRYNVDGKSADGVSTSFNLFCRVK